MPKRKARSASNPTPLVKSPTGIEGLDEITLGGLPKGRPTLVCGSAGCGKTLLGMEFLVRGARQFGEPGVCMSFEERTSDLVHNVASLGFDLQDLIDRDKLVIDHVHVERSQIEETGEYDLEGLFVRLNYAIDSIGAKRVLLDTIESLFAGLANESVLRSELRRLFLWLKEKGVTAVITGEKGEGTLTRHGLEEYVSDCVILLDHRMVDSVSTRRLRVVKYRGSTHATNEYPFLINERGFSVLPLSELNLDHSVSNQRLASGVPALDDMLDGQGFYRGSSVLISGTPGTGKSSLAASIVLAAGNRGERCLVFAFEESQAQTVRNMKSIGVNLEPLIKKNLLVYEASRPTMYGLEMHLVRMHKAIREHNPSLVVIDPISSLMLAGDPREARSTTLRLVDFLKQRGITGIFTNLVGDASHQEQTEISISSLIDTWILLRDIEIGGERNRGLHVLKSRGMAHSNQIREFILTGRGIQLQPVYVGPSGVLTGSARVALEARDQAEELTRQQEAERRRLELQRKCSVLEAQIVALQADLNAERQELERASAEEAGRARMRDQERARIAASRRAQPSRQNKDKNASEAVR